MDRKNIEADYIRSQRKLLERTSREASKIKDHKIISITGICMFCNYVSYDYKTGSDIRDRNTIYYTGRLSWICFPCQKKNQIGKYSRKNKGK